jgi:hypothetical protein
VKGSTATFVLSLAQSNPDTSNKKDKAIINLKANFMVFSSFILAYL